MLWGDLSEEEGREEVLKKKAQLYLRCWWGAWRLKVKESLDVSSWLLLKMEVVVTLR